MHIGTQKAGSTYLYNLLSSHPEVGLSPLSEVNFFSDHFDRGLTWYQSVFPKEGILIDCSPTYFKYGKQSADRIHETYGLSARELSFLLILRNPIDYVHSHFLMQRQQGYFAKRPDLYPVPPDTLLVCARMYPEYLKRGRYAELLSEWLEHFSREQFLIVPFEQFVTNEQDVLSKILTFLQLPDRTLFAPAISQNRALRHRSLSQGRDFLIRHPKLKELLKKNPLFQYVIRRFLTQDTTEVLTTEARAELRALFAHDVARLSKEYGVDISSWKDFV